MSIANGAILDAPVAPKVSVVICTIGQPPLVNCCISETRRLATLPIEIILVDNGSTERESTTLATIKPNVLLHHPDALGYAAANNAGIAASHGEYVLLLNNDAWPTRRGWDARLISVLQGVPDAMLVAPTAPRVYWTDQHANGPQAENCELIDARNVAFVAVMLRRSTLDAIGPLDERFLVGAFEDDDYCLRIRKAGGRILVDPACFFFHVGSMTMQPLYEAVLPTNHQLFLDKWKDDSYYVETTINQTSG